MAAEFLYCDALMQKVVQSLGVGSQTVDIGKNVFLTKLENESLNSLKPQFFGRKGSWVILSSPVRIPEIVFSDMDSTIVVEETLDHLAIKKGLFDEVSSITKEAMEKGFDFSESFRLRINLLVPIDSADVLSVSKGLTYYDGVKDFFSLLNQKSVTSVLITGGLQEIADSVKEKLKIDFAHASQLVWKEGQAEGGLICIFDQVAKKKTLKDYCEAKKVDLKHGGVWGFGDGANDQMFLGDCSVAIGVDPKPILFPHLDGKLDALNGGFYFFSELFGQLD